MGVIKLTAQRLIWSTKKNPTGGADTNEGILPGRKKGIAKKDLKPTLQLSIEFLTN